MTAFDYDELRRKVYGALLLGGPTTLDTLAAVTGYPASVLVDSEVLIDLQRAGIVIGDYDTDGFKALMPDDYAALDNLTLLDIAGNIIETLRAGKGEGVPF